MHGTIHAFASLRHYPASFVTHHRGWKDVLGHLPLPWPYLQRLGCILTALAQRMTAAGVANDRRQLEYAFGRQMHGKGLARRSFALIGAPS